MASSQMNTPPNYSLLREALTYLETTPEIFILFAVTAAENGRIEALRFLLENGAKIDDIKDRRGNSLGAILALNGHCEQAIKLALRYPELKDDTTIMTNTMCHGAPNIAALIAAGFKRLHGHSFNIQLQYHDVTAAQIIQALKNLGAHKQANLLAAEDLTPHSA